MKGLAAVACITLALVLMLASPAASQHANRAACTQIANEFRRQGASAYVANRFAAIAWRESGCVPQHVVDRDDRSFSRLGLNFIGRMPAYWFKLCGVSNYYATANLRIDVKCAFAAYRQSGFRPWRN